MEVSAKNLGNRIKELRTLHKLTQEQLAENANLHVSYIGIIERGEKNISVKALNEILTALNISLLEFFKPFNHSSSNQENEDIYDLVLLPLQSLPENEKNKILEIIRLSISLTKK